MTPQVSVLIPLYKPNPAHLTETLDRLIGQTERDFECIICEEPTDVDISGTLAKYLNDPRFTHYRNEKCLGIGGNWNRCFSYATAPVIAYLFQDDLWDRDYLEAALKIFQAHPSVGFISMNHRYQYDEDLWTVEGYETLQKTKDEVLREGFWKGHEFLKLWLRRELHPNLIGEPPFVVLRKKVLEDVGPFHTSMPQFLDVEYWLRCLLKTDWYYEKNMHGAFRVHGNAASFRNNESGEGIYDRLECFEMLIRTAPADLKKIAIQSRNRAIESMAKKFLIRLKKRQTVATKGGGQVINFALRHPFLIGTAMGKVLWRRLRNA
ncbi:hypothetical protein A3D88_03255 [Candidatus Peribacteria bacterium RIFCSPHIGHO2_02_FULL_52_16]|nr:MAG: hypothetical protein A2706_04075 [Candidatus Peribacteria bacterium RIFCSPHIGHO2_01_FULL_51_35]OGJ61350.1 MAG: hypothetical protein A3D88_03255 [Candidatus Peribacteria bacterium RIFCSPHIGHO2_02_FULL_52_16]